MIASQIPLFILMAGNNGEIGLVRCKRQRGICQNFAADADGIMWQFSLSEEEKVTFLELCGAPAYPDLQRREQGLSPSLPAPTRTLISYKFNLAGVFLGVLLRFRLVWPPLVDLPEVSFSLLFTAGSDSKCLIIAACGIVQPWFSSIAGVAPFLICTSRELLVTH